MSKKKKKNKGHVKKEIKEVEEAKIEEKVSKVLKEEIVVEKEKEVKEKKEEEKVDKKVAVKATKEETKSKEEEVAGQATLAELDQVEESQKKMKNLVAAVILLTGIAIGSFFVDVFQFMSGDGFSKRALDNSEVLVNGDKTWVAFDEPAIDVKVLTVSDEEMESCKGCDPKEVLLWLRDYIPTMVVNSIDVESEDGKALVEAYDVKALPTYFFSNEIEETKFFQGEGRVVFAEKNGSFVLNSAGLGVPVGKYLQTPEVFEKDAVLGNKDAKTQVIVFSDFQCPYCGEHFKNIKETVESFGSDKVSLVYKDFPLSFHLQGKNSAMAARCAQDQDKFWEMGELLYEFQKDWQDTEGTAKFKKYARDLKLDANKFNKCMDEKTSEALIEEDVDQANEIGIAGAPATFISTQFSSGVLSAMEINEMIQRELDKDSEDIDEDEESKEVSHEEDEKVKVQ